jgi:5'-phosphate synthase pdxT subunit
LELIVGVLALQGDFAEHKEILDKLKTENILVKTKEELEKVNGLIIPGGESTTIGKLLKETGLGKKILIKAKKNMPVFGTCAGAILLAKKIIGKKEFSLGLINAVLERNAFGRQNDSFEEKISTSFGKIDVSFIRAPRIKSIGKNVQVIGKLNKEPVIVREKKVLISTCHPEITANTKLHEYFIGMIKES